MNKRLILKQEFNFPPTTRFVGYLFLASSFMTMLNMPIFGLILALVFSYISFSKTNNKIDLEAGTINHRDLPRKNFPLGTYVNLSLLSANKTTSTFSRGNRKTSSTDMEFQIVLLNTKHTKKLIIEKHLDKELAMERIEELAESLEMEIVKYNPQITSRKVRR